MTTTTKGARRLAVLLGVTVTAVLATAFAPAAHAATRQPLTPPAATAAPGPHAAQAAQADRTPATAGQAVNKGAAAAWALANWNGGYNGFADDCTDFVSRALSHGGDPFTYPRGLSGGTSDDHYWYYFTVRYGRWYSHSWTVAHDLAVHLNLIHSYWIRYWNNAQPGDVIFANWSGPNFAGISHVGIITRMVNGVPQITQHSPSQRNVSLNYWLTHGGPNVHVWIASPNAG